MWPKFRMRRRPDSFSSAATTARLDAARLADDRAPAPRARARRSPCDRWPTRSNSAGLDVMPYLTTSYRPGAELAARQRAEHGRIDDDRVRLIEGADQVLAERVVDAHLAADGAVHLRQQRRRHVHERDAAQVGRGGEAGHVADDAAAEGDERGRAVGVRADERVVDARDRLRAVLKRSPSGTRIGSSTPAALSRAAVEPPDERARHDEASRGGAAPRRAAHESCSMHAVAERDRVARGTAWRRRCAGSPWRRVKPRVLGSTHWPR